MKPTILYDLRSAPAYQNKMFDTREAALACPTGDVVLAEDVATGIVANVAFDPGLLRYDETYQNEQGVSPHFRTHLEQVLSKVEAAFGTCNILEIGCGKGYFVELMRAHGLQARGIDGAYEGQAPYIEKRHFGTIAEPPADAIVLRHVLEHIPDPLDFLDLIKTANAGHGLIYIEVPCFDWIMRNNAWFDVFYEHVNYFRLSDFHRIFGRIVDSGYLFGGQYLFAIADISTFCKSPRPAPAAKVEFPRGFTRSIETLASNARATPERRRVIWGAAAKGVMFSHRLDQLGVKFEAAVDINPAKQGRFLGVTGLPVSAPGPILSSLPESSEIYVMNSNYLSEISGMGGPRFHYIPVDQL